MKPVFDCPTVHSIGPSAHELFGVGGDLHVNRSAAPLISAPVRPTPPKPKPSLMDRVGQHLRQGLENLGERVAGEEPVIMPDGTKDYALGHKPSVVNYR